ncbi:maleylpyruvate isomerase family mycothiol-dependent enzyme [Brevibacterium permense]|uniref:maleylpyruvate isomerase family mycothiol-dependent enzyme n=1 Tax=Brevibacterium permense TaxID=234834 RepID=UPI0021CF717F|nr:maleylpyruvate isomerase family mycothiol-dependent enzyme [Brevibacterium permense]MCU4297921.1 maleylpyruvate isomerase family mycothiol-dependent enzyme [Brevibacterium permense]
MTSESEDARELESFTAGTKRITALVSTIGDERWAAPGLGRWDVRGPVGHTSRAFNMLVTALDRPAEAFNALCESALTKVSTLSPADADATIMTAAGGMRAGDYVRTRTCELVVHGIDIDAALGVEPTVPEAALRESLALAAGLAMQSGTSSSVLAGLTGRGGLAEDFTVLG